MKVFYIVVDMEGGPKFFVYYRQSIYIKFAQIKKLFYIANLLAKNKFLKSSKHLIKEGKQFFLILYILY